MVPVLPLTTIVGANGCGGDDVTTCEIEMVEVGKREVEIVLGRLDGVVIAGVEAEVGPLVRVNCVIGTGDVCCGGGGGEDGADSSVQNVCLSFLSFKVLKIKSFIQTSNTSS